MLDAKIFGNWSLYYGHGDLSQRVMIGARNRFGQRWNAREFISPLNHAGGEGALQSAIATDRTGQTAGAIVIICIRLPNYMMVVLSIQLAKLSNYAVAIRIISGASTEMEVSTRKS